MAWVNLVVLGLLAALLGIIAWRLTVLSTQGMTAIIRKGYEGGIDDWRHGVVIFRPEALLFYKVRSLLPARDASYERSYIEITGHRDVTPQESQIMPEVERAVLFTVHGQPYAMVAPRPVLMAFTAWVESAPHARKEALDHKRLVRRVRRGMA